MVLTLLLNFGSLCSTVITETEWILYLELLTGLCVSEYTGINLVKAQQGIRKYDIIAVAMFEILL